MLSKILDVLKIFLTALSTYLAYRKGTKDQKREDELVTKRVLLKHMEKSNAELEAIRNLSDDALNDELRKRKPPSDSE